MNARTKAQDTPCISVRVSKVTFRPIAICRCGLLEFLVIGVFGRDDVNALELKGAFETLALSSVLLEFMISCTTASVHVLPS